VSGIGATPRRRRWPRRLAGMVAAGIAAWGLGLVWFAGAIPGRVADPDTPTDAIVVLTGGSERLAAGLDLLAAGRARKLFVSGVYRGVEVAELLRLSRQAPERLRCCITLGYTAGDTEGNARETAAWMAAEGYTSLRLVTANYHLRRSLLEFARAMPRATVIAHPVFPPGFKREDWWRWPGTARLLAVEYNKYLAALARGLIAGPTRP